MRESAKMLGISHSTISRYKAGFYKKWMIDINKKYSSFINYFYNHYDRRYCSVDIVIHIFKNKCRTEKYPSVQQVYNWIKNDKLELRIIHYTTKENGQIIRKAEWSSILNGILIIERFYR